MNGPHKAHPVVSAMVALSLLLIGSPAGATKTKSKRGKKVVKPTVAVLYFDYAGKDGDLAVLRKGLAQMLITDLSEIEQITVVERSRLENLLAEMKLASTKKVARKTAARIGKLLGARHLVLGSYFSLMGTFRIDTRVVNVESGALELTFGATGKNEDFMAVHMKVAEGLKKHIAKALVASDKATVKGRKPRPKVRKRPPIKRPKSLSVRTAVEYAKGLDAMDRKDLKTAKRQLNKVLKRQPDFGLARQDLAMLMQ